MRALKSNLGKASNEGGGGGIADRNDEHLDSDDQGKLQYRTKETFLTECGVDKTGGAACLKSE